MKAIIVEEMAAADSWAGLRGDFSWIKRIIVPELRGLAITLADGKILVFSNFDIDEAKKSHSEDAEDEEVFRVLKEIEIPDELAHKAHDFSIAKEEFEKNSDEYKKLF